MTNAIKVFTPNSQHQKDFINAVADPNLKYVTLLSGRQAGKSWAGAAAAGNLIYNTDRCKLGIGWCMAYNYPQSVAAQKAFINVMGYVGLGGTIRKHAKAENAFILACPGRGHGREWTHKDCQTPKCTGCYRVEFKSADNPFTLLGRTVDFLWVDETAKYPDPGDAYFETLPVVSISGGPVFNTTTPNGADGSWFYEQVYLAQKNNSRSKFIRATMLDNPCQTEQSVRDLAGTFSRVRYEQDVLGEFRTPQGAIYPFDSSSHVFLSTQDTPAGDIIAGVDFGWKPDPFVYIWVKKVKKAGGGYRYFVMDELFMTETPPDERVQEIRKNKLEAQTYGRYADHDPENVNFMARKGMPCWQAVKDITYGIGLVTSYMEKGDLLISDSCKKGIIELSNYVWDKKKQKPKANQDDHFCDALRYVIASEEALNYENMSGHAIAHDDGTITIVDAKGNKTKDVARNVSVYTAEQKRDMGRLSQEQKWIQAIEHAKARWKPTDGGDKPKDPPQDRWGL